MAYDQLGAFRKLLDHWDRPLKQEAEAIAELQSAPSTSPRYFDFGESRYPARIHLQIADSQLCSARVSERPPQ